MCVESLEVESLASNVGSLKASEEGGGIHNFYLLGGGGGGGGGGNCLIGIQCTNMNAILPHDKLLACAVLWLLPHVQSYDVNNYIVLGATGSEIPLLVAVVSPVSWPRACRARREVCRKAAPLA